MPHLLLSWKGKTKMSSIKNRKEAFQTKELAEYLKALIFEIKTNVSNYFIDVYKLSYDQVLEQDLFNPKLSEDNIFFLNRRIAQQFAEEYIEDYILTSLEEVQRQHKIEPFVNGSDICYLIFMRMKLEEIYNKWALDNNEPIMDAVE